MFQLKWGSVGLGAVLAAVSFLSVAAEETRLRPYVLGQTPTGTLEQVTDSVRSVLKAQGFEEVGSYSPYAGAVVIVVTNADLKAAAARAKNGGFGVGQRVAVTNTDKGIQVSYVNPVYMAAAYGLGSLDAVAVKLKAALGAEKEFGSEGGYTAPDLASYRYNGMIMMPNFSGVDLLASHASHTDAVQAVERNLAAGKGGTKKVYRIDLPGKEASVFGVAIVTGDGVDKGDKDTDKEIMDIVDWKPLRHTAYLPYEIMVQGKDIIALRGRYRIALHFPDTSMMGEHGFTKIMSSPGGIKAALKAVAEAGK
jgi:hypothetical protein